MVKESKIKVRDVPKEWREIERIRRRLKVSMANFAFFLGLCFQSYHDRVSGRRRGSYAPAFLALAEKVERQFNIIGDFEKATRLLSKRSGS